MTTITSFDPLWHQTYPNSLKPRDGESLAGFALRLDEANRLDARATLRAINRYGMGPHRSTQPGMLLSARTYRLHELAKLAGNVPIAQIERLTAVELVRWLFAGQCWATTLRAKKSIVVCSACLRDRFIPLVTLLRGVDACPTHGQRLRESCDCGGAITLFPVRGGRPFSCPHAGCGRDYGELELEPSTSADLERSEMYTHAYASLFEIAASAPPPMPRKELRARLYAMLVSVDLRREDAPRLFSRVLSPSLATVADICVRAKVDVRDALLTPFTAASRRRTGKRTRSFGASCPNPECAGGARIYGNGTHSALGGAHERLCLGCGTRWVSQAILFSFDWAPGYSIVRASRNAARLLPLRARLERLCADAYETGQPIVRTHLFTAAGVPKALVYLSHRAGLVEIVQRWKRKIETVGAARIAAPTKGPLAHQ